MWSSQSEMLPTRQSCIKLQVATTRFGRPSNLKGGLPTLNRTSTTSSSSSGGQIWLWRPSTGSSGPIWTPINFPYIEQDHRSPFKTVYSPVLRPPSMLRHIDVTFSCHQVLCFHLAYLGYVFLHLPAREAYHSSNYHSTRSLLFNISNQLFALSCIGGSRRISRKYSITCPKGSYKYVFVSIQHPVPSYRGMTRSVEPEGPIGIAAEEVREGLLMGRIAASKLSCVIE
jgi:hypothetical protein